MQTTNYEISKQLAEAGFESAINWVWIELNGDLLRIHLSQFHLVHPELEKIIAYDFETILEALPRTVVLKTIPKKIYELQVWFNSNKNQIGYQDFQGFHPVLTVAQQENESLADVSARLLLLLHEKNLIKF
jgi:hypothetical protein